MRAFVIFAALALPGLLFAPACGRAADPPAGSIQIELVSGATARDAVVRATGLSGAELRVIARAQLDEAAWQQLMPVSVSDNFSAPIAGQYQVTGIGIEFRPRFAFDPGRSYSVRFDPGRLPNPRRDEVVNARVRLATAVRSPSTTGAAIFPSADVWPENMLRFYIHFSAPMSRGAGTRFVHLVDDRGEEVPDAILAAYADLWNDDATRLTVFFDPGRVKRGIGPNVAMGRAIVNGRRYAIVVDPAWHDAAGQPLASPFRRTFTAGPAAYRALSTRDWRIAAPQAGTRNPLTVTFPAPLDRALLDRALGVRTASGAPVSGRIRVGQAETTWEFVPDAPWPSGAHQLAVLTALEDPAGNKIGRAFEVLTRDPAHDPPDPDIVTVSFAVK